MSHCQALLRQSPNNPRFEVGLGSALIGKKDFTQAQQIFDASLARQPNPPAFYGKALAYREQGDLTRAIANMGKASEMDPANPVYRNLLAQLKGAAQ